MFEEMTLVVSYGTIKRYKYILKYLIENWKMIIHLLFRTKRFGVNNEWWSSFDSIFGWSNKKKLKAILTVKPIIDNYKMMVIRSAIGFVPWADFMMIVSRKQFNRMFPNRDYDEEFKDALNPQPHDDCIDCDDPTYR